MSFFFHFTFAECANKSNNFYVYIYSTFSTWVLLKPITTSLENNIKPSLSVSPAPFFHYFEVTIWFMLTVFSHILCLSTSPALPELTSSYLEALALPPHLLRLIKINNSFQIVSVYLAHKTNTNWKFSQEAIYSRFSSNALMDIIIIK